MLLYHYFGSYRVSRYVLFFFIDTATTEIYTLSLHDALPILGRSRRVCCGMAGLRSVRWLRATMRPGRSGWWQPPHTARSEEHTSELQSRQYLVCRLLLEKKKNAKTRLSDKSPTCVKEPM